ncbi:hypothetical protein [Rhizobium sp.]|jgi:hypothetical protein|uniref:hypothetical protein n=1 Tax=Rhizobium sp. TaxID=391 RepID=UPI000E98F715|nr:hypothetical protein [Rhizobium sp.]
MRDSVREFEKITLIIAPNMDAAAHLAREMGIRTDTFRDGRTFRIVTNVAGLRGWRDGTACLIDFGLFDRDHTQLKDLAHTLLAQGRIRRASFNELRELRGEVV